MLIKLLQKLRYKTVKYPELMADVCIHFDRKRWIASCTGPSGSLRDSVQNLGSGNLGLREAQVSLKNWW